MKAIESDVLIIGGGLVGSALANALAEIAVSSILVETKDPNTLEQSSFDARATALASGSRGVLETLGLWPAIAAEAEPIRLIHVSEQGQFGTTTIAAEEEGVEALGYTVENRVLGRALWNALDSAKGFRCVAPASLESFEIDADGVTATVSTADGPLQVRSRLLVGADGARSSVRRALGIATREDDYAHKAVVFNCSTEKPLAGRAFERFTPDGPLAVLPLTRGRASIVWNLKPDDAQRLLEATEAQASELLQQAFGYRLGAIERVGERAVYALSRVRSVSSVADRAVLIGNAVLSLHPVAGQSFNLALRDVATLAEVIAGAREGDVMADIGAAGVLSKYASWRATDQRTVAAFTHGLIRLFGLGLPGAGVIRGLGLAAFDMVPGGKALLARHTMGRAGRLPRLTRGLGLAD